MKARMFVLSLAAAGALAAGAVSEPGEGKALKVLMIGNSFSQSVLWQTPQFAKSAGLTLDLAQCYIGGCSLETHCANVACAATNAAGYADIWMPAVLPHFKAICGK